MSTHTLIEALEKWKCPGCDGAGKRHQLSGPPHQTVATAVACVACGGDGLHPVARTALATHRAGTGEPHAFADCIKADGDKPCRDCSEYAQEAVGVPHPEAAPTCRNCGGMRWVPLDPPAMDPVPCPDCTARREPR